MSAAERFWVKVDKTDTCWIWTAAMDGHGYGNFDNRGAHRWAYEYHNGPIPKGLQLDHLCRVRNCVNPDHLEPVTSRENSLRGVTIQAANAAKTHCPQGHEYTPENTKVRVNGRGHAGRHCLACVAERALSRPSRARAKAPA